ncbi:unnamed protein product [Ectocarpus fasciculatus]
MGAAGSVGTSSTAPRKNTNSSGKYAVDGQVQPAAEQFETSAKMLASKYHDLRLSSSGGAEGAAGSASLLNNGLVSLAPMPSRSSSSPPPKARNTRLSVQRRRDVVAEPKIDDEVCVTKAPPTAGRQNEGQDISMDARTGLSPEIGNVADANDGNGVERGSRAPSSLDHFVHRDDMIGLARDLGYDITPEQATAMFDMLDSERQGRVLESDLFKHFLPLLEKTGRSGPPRKESTGRKKSSVKGSVPRRPRPSASRPSGSKTPPRPAGTPPATAKRRITSPPPGGGRGDTSSAATSTMNQTSSPPSRGSPQRQKRHSAASADALNLTLSPGYLRERPSKFWLTPEHGGGGDPPASGPLAPLEDRVEPVENRTVSGPPAPLEGRVEPVESGVERNNETEHVDGSKDNSHYHTENEQGKAAILTADRAENGTNRQAEEHAGGTSGAPTEEAREVAASGDLDAEPTVDPLAGKNVLEWTAVDVQTWIRALPRGLAAFAEAEAFAKGRVDGKKLATLTLSDIKRKDFRHAKFKAKIPTALWVEIKRIQQTVPAPVTAVTAAAAAATTAAVLPSRFSPGQTIVDEAVNTPLCTVKQSVGQGAFGEVYQVVWTGIGSDRGSTLAMKTVRLADISSDERDEYRVLLMEEILTAVRVKPHPNVVNVRFAHIMGFCSENEEYFCFEDFVTGKSLEELVAEGEGELYDGTPAEIQGRLLSYSIQLARGLGHVHRCGVLHQDIKSANIMVSNDAGLLITDFGFATVGQFGPPPRPPAEKPTVDPAIAATDAGVEPVGEGLEKGCGCDKASASGNLPSGVDTSSGNKPERPSGWIPGDSESGGPHTSASGNRCCGSMERDMIAAKGRQQARTDAGGAAEKAQEQHSCPVVGTGAGPPVITKASPATTPAEPAGRRSPLVGNGGGPGGAGKQIMDGNRGASGLLEHNGDSGRPPNRDRVLFGTLKGYTPRYQSPEVSAIMKKKDEAAAAAAAAAATAAVVAVVQEGDQSLKTGAQQNPPAPRLEENHDMVDAWHSQFSHRSDMWAAGVVVLEMYAGGLANLPAGQGDNALELLETLARNTVGHDGGHINCSSNADGEDKTKKRRDTFLVDMPEGVLAVLRNVFLRTAENRPFSMEALAVHLSETLGGMLEKKLAVVPCPSAGAPSSSSLCEQAPVYVECDENHAKVGRLHMWLGKALFLKGDDRREQALQEYREGVRVLLESEADRRSPSMALFRWYLGKALLENGEIDEALPHLVESVSIDPENAKYRHTLGLAKCVTGDEAGAREDLLEAALLDEEDAEDRYQLRMQRIDEKRRKSAEEEQQRVLRSSQESGGADTPQAAASPKPGDAAATGTSLAATTPTGESTAAMSGFAQSRLLALERASSSTRTYALEKLSDYRTNIFLGKGIGDTWGGGGGVADHSDYSFGDKNTRDGSAIAEVRRFSVGDEIVGGPDTSVSGKSLEQLHCCGFSSPYDDTRVDTDISARFVIGGLLSPGQASLHIPGEAYTATRSTTNRCRQQPDDSAHDCSRSYHVIHVRFETGTTTQASASPTYATPAVAEAVTGATGDNHLATIDERQGKVHRAGAEATAGPVAAGCSSGVTGGNKTGRSMSSSRSISPTNRLALLSSTHSKRQEEYVPMLKAMGRAAMVGFHAQLAGAVRQLRWEASDLTLIADDLPGVCLTLREACTSGSLYRGTGMGTGGSSSSSRGHHATRDDQRVNAPMVVERILKIAKQMAAAILHCHHQGVLLRTTTPDNVLVTPEWDAILRPNYSHAYEAQRWTTVSIRAQQQQRQALRPSGANPDKLLAAPFTNATSSDYQASSLNPEIAQMRSENEPRQRVSGRAQRLSATLTGTGVQEERLRSVSSPIRGHPSISLERATTRGRAQSGADYVAGGVDKDLGRHRRCSSETAAEDRQQTGASKRGRTGRRSLGRRQGEGFDGTGEHTEPSSPSSLSRPTSAAAGGGQPMITACESDIWAWALMVLQMFSDDAWPPGSGQKGLPALEALLLRRQGVDAWTTEDVVSWLRDIGLWSEKTEREIRAFKIDGPHLLVPTCRRDIVEKLGLFITDGELSCKLWDSIAGGLQRWSMPSPLAQILRRCLADSPKDRFSSMEEVCRHLHGIAAGGGGRDDAASAVSAASDYRCGEDVASDRVRTGMILNDVGVCLCSKGKIEESERYYKMALLSSEEVFEAYYNLGLLYSTAAFNKFREAQQMFDAATERMNHRDLRRKSSMEYSRAAERKSNYHQSQEIMKALSGKYNCVSPNSSRDRGGGAAAAAGGAGRSSHHGGGGSGAMSEGANGDNRRASFPPEQKHASSTSAQSLGRSSASSSTTDATGVAQTPPSSRSPPRMRSSTPSRDPLN